MAGVLFDQIIEKLNPYHGKDGRFTTADAAASFTYKPGASTAHDKAIEREKERNAKGFKGRLYHGSPATDIEEFDMARAGQNTSSGEKLLFFTDSKQMADDFSYERLEGSTTFMQRRGKKGRVYEVDVEMENPLDLRSLSEKDISNLMQLDPDGILTPKIAAELSAKNNQQLKTYLDLTADNLKDLGYDGLIAHTGKAGHNSIEYAVVDSKQAKIRKSGDFDEIVEIEKFNPYHGKDGRFTTSGAYASFTYSPGKSKAHDLAIQREKDRTAGRMPTEAQAKTLKGIETRTRNLKKEQFRVVDRDGNVIMQKQGDEGSVTFTMGEARDHFPGNITIHNHPDGGTFSPPDLSAIGHGATEIRAASPEGTYILRNARYGGKYNAAREKTWYDMREDIEAASEGFKTHRQVKAEIRKPFDAQVEPLAQKWVDRKQAGADKAELDQIYGEYTAMVESFRPQIEAAARTAYVDQYHHWYKANAGKYGLEYEFIPVKTRTRKGYDEEMIENIGKGVGEEIVLDRKMNQDAKELADAVMAELLGRFPAARTAKSFDEILKANPYHDPKNGRFTTGPGGSAGAAVGHNGVTTKEQDKAYMAAVEAGDIETAQRMVLETAKAVGAKTFANPDTTAYSIRRGPEPQTTVKAYKTFFVDDQGNPSALFVEGTERLPVGVWLDAKDAYHFQAENGKMYTPSRKNPNSGGSGKTGASIKIPNDQVRQELIDQGFLPEGSTASSVTALAYRPGWHAGDLPFFPQGGKQGNPELSESGKPNKRYDPSKPATNYANIHRYNQVVFECEMAADIDYTKSTSIKSGENKGKIKYTDMQEMPTDGYYKFATNPMTNANDLGNWYISGSLKITRALTQEECDTILGQNGFKPQEWEGGKLDLGKLGYNPSKTDRGTKLLDPVTYDDKGKVIPLSQRFDNSSDDVRKAEEEVAKWDPSQPRDKFGMWTSGGGGGFGMKPMAKPAMPRAATPRPAIQKPAAPPSPAASGSGTDKPQSGQLTMQMKQDLGSGKYPDRATAQKAYIREMTGQSEAEAEATLKEMHRYTREDWRSADTAILDKYIDQDHAYHARDGIARGMVFDDAGYQKFAQNIKPGAQIGMRGNSSWTSEMSSAQDFAESSDLSKNSVIIKCVHNKTSSPIAHLSAWQGESEVLARSTTKWKVLDVKEYAKKGAQTKTMYITVEEV